MAGLLVANLARHRGRTLATAVGIALGVAAIVALLSAGAGLKRTAGQLVHLGSSDFGIFQSGVSDPTASVLPVSLARRIEHRPDIAQATPLLLVIEGVRQDPAAVTFGVDPNGFVAQRLVMTRGVKSWAPGAVLLGDRLAAELGARPGSTVRLKRRAFSVAGVYHTGVYFQDTGAVISLRSAQRLTHRPGDATTIAVQVAMGVSHASAAAALRRSLPGTQVIATPDDAVRSGANGVLIGKAVTIIGTLALIIGGLGVTNTMAMAVLERERELALLSAVGWKSTRIAALVLAEGVVTSLLGAALGLLLGVLGARGLGSALGVSAVVSPYVSPWTVGQALLVGVAIGLVGGLYPAWRATSASPAGLLAA
jgi:putative ABC transport system permease protein